MVFTRIACLFTALVFYLNASLAQTSSVDLIPKPNKLIKFDGDLDLSQPFPLYFAEEFKDLTTTFSDLSFLSISTQETDKKRKKGVYRNIRILKAVDADKLPIDAFYLSINDQQIVLKAHREQEMISAIYTLYQLRLLQSENKLPFIEIEDKPRFGYRGLHLDVSRHFMPVSFLKKYIDIMALYKFNHFHWHLTDGAGWRIEIKKYPELTTKAAWRTHVNFADWDANGKQYLDQTHPNASGGYYSQAQAKELVAYARKRGITIVPEIEISGHSEEVTSIYPELSCTGKPYTQNELCLGNEKTFEFLKNVLDEVIEIFPSPYIHIGGDEADKTHWKSCEKCQALKEKLGLKNEDELQTYAIKQINEYVKSKGRKIIGWDEVLQNGLDKDVAIMNWRGEEEGIKAANSGYPVIMTPQSHLYFDFYQFDPRTQPKAFGGYTTLEKVYAYNPMSSKINKGNEKNVLGAQANLWTEYMSTPQQVEYMAFPRALALSEINWTNQENRDFSNFKKRLQGHYAILRKMEVNYYRPSFDVTYHVDFDAVKKVNTIGLSSEQFDPSIRYTIDGSDPLASSTVYSKPLLFGVSTVVKAASFIDSTRVSPITTVHLDIHKGIGKAISYNKPWNKAYPAQGLLSLLDGRTGGITYQDGNWQGFSNDIDVEIDLDRREEINSVSAKFMEVPEAGVFYPGEIRIFASDNGKNYREVGVQTNQHVSGTKVLDFRIFKIEFSKPIMARYIKFVATNPKKGLLFLDEIVVD